MANIILFIIKLYKELQKDDLFSVANDLTYKILLALFPFTMFLMSVISYFDIDPYFFIFSLEKSLPGDVMEVITPFILDITEVKRPSVLSFSILFTIFSASSGFNTVMAGINKAYGRKDERNFIHKRFVSIVLVLIFALSVALSMVMLIFNDKIYKLVLQYTAGESFLEGVFGLLGYMITVGALLISVMAINALALSKVKSIVPLLPGAVFTVVCWIVLSKAFNVYVNNFSRYSAVYGSVASIMLLLIWLNLISITLLTGSEINAMITVD